MAESDWLFLKYGYDFNENTIEGYSIDNLANSAGLADVGTTHHTGLSNRDWAETGGIGGSGAASQNSGSMNLTGVNISATTGFTIAAAFNVNNVEWGTMLDIDLGNGYNSFNSKSIADGQTGLNYTEKALNDLGLVVEANAWNAMVLSVSSNGTNSNVSIYVYASDGSLVKENTFTLNSVVTLESIGLGDQDGDARDNSKTTLIDNFLIYEGAAEDWQADMVADQVLTASEITSSSSLQAIIPEPSTATLSVLALASLMLRRRRLRSA